MRKLTLIGPVTICSPKLVPPKHLPSRAFFKQKKKEKKPIQQLHRQPGRETVEGKEGQKKAHAKQQVLSKREPQNGTSFKGLKSIEHKVQTHAMLIYLA